MDLIFQVIGELTWNNFLSFIVSSKSKIYQISLVEKSFRNLY